MVSRMFILIVSRRKPTQSIELVEKESAAEQIDVQAHAHKRS